LSAIKVDIPWLSFGVAIFLLYWYLASHQISLFAIIGFELNPLLGHLGLQLNWPWGAKLTLVAYTLTVIACVIIISPQTQLKDALLTWQQRPDSILIGTGVIIGLLFFRYYLSYLIGGDDGVLDPEELTFLLTAHSIDKELFFHGLLFCVLVKAIQSNSTRCFGVPINAPGITCCLAFALFHSILFKGEMQWHFLPLAFGLNLFHGLVYLWLALRSGSLVIPIIAHGVVLFFSQHLT